MLICHDGSLLPTLLPTPRSVNGVANVAIILGYFGVLSFDAGHFERHGSQPVLQADWANAPVFFGIVMSAYEGIGTILPIEVSLSIQSVG